MFCLRAMTGAIILFDHVAPEGAFGRRSSINVKSNAAAHSSSSHLFSSFFSRQIKAAVTVLKGYTNSPTDGLLNALRFTTIHLNDSETPNTIKQLLNWDFVMFFFFLLLYGCFLLLGLFFFYPSFSSLQTKHKKKKTKKKMSFPHKILETYTNCNCQKKKYSLFFSFFSLFFFWLFLYLLFVYIYVVAFLCFQTKKKKKQGTQKKH